MARKKTKPGPKQLLLMPSYDRRFFEDAIGRTILAEPKVAIIELIANAFDAYARKVVIQLPDVIMEQPFSIEDDGSGMTHEQFQERWMKLSYNRVEHQGIYAEKPPSCASLPNRRAFGRNGKGRHAGFCFADGEFFVETHRDGKRNLYRVFRPQQQDTPFNSERLNETKSTKTGTRIYAQRAVDLMASSDEIRGEIGMRFLSDPSMEVIVDGKRVVYDHIPDHCKTTTGLSVPDVGDIILQIIDTKESDKTTKLHGIAWQVRGRLVGEASWKNFGDEKFIDGRSTAAKRFVFIVQADCLDQQNFIYADWTGFNMQEEKVKKAFEAVNEKIRQFLLEQSFEERQSTFKDLQAKNASLLKRMGPRNAEIWRAFIKKVQEECPSISERELENMGAILAKLEASTSKYSLLHTLTNCSSEDFDKLNQIMESWTVETAKIVLDELQTRLSLIAELESKALDNRTDELHDLQPIFDAGLWIFGPEFESIHFTSNESMVTVIRKLMKVTDAVGSRNRPDFVILPDGTVNFHSLPAYDENHEEDGVSHLVIVELKKPSVALGVQEQNQCWGYVKELMEKGAIKDHTPVTCFLLGKTIQPREERETKKGTACIIRPMTYQSVIGRAKARTFSLYNKVKQVPFLQERGIDAFLQPEKVDADVQLSLLRQDLS